MSAELATNGGRKVRLHGKYGEGRVAIVDARYLSVVESHKWYLTLAGYATANVTNASGNRSSVTLHRYVAGIAGIGLYPRGDVDHRNRNKLDCRVENLRPATRTQNNANIPRRSHSRHPFKGIRRRDSRWQARIRVEGREINLGRFDTAEEAAHAYNLAAKSHFGEFAFLNVLSGERS